MGWIIILGVLLGLAILPLGVSVVYDQNGALVRLMIGPVRVRLFPGRKKKQLVNQKRESKKKNAPAKQSSQKKQGGSWRDFIPLVEVILELLYKFKSKIRVDRLELKLILAGDDPCDLAVNYGKAWAALGNFMPQLERFFVIKKRDLEVECDFTADQSMVFAAMDLTITVGRLVSLVVVYGLRVLREFLRITKLRKGGAKV